MTETRDQLSEQLEATVGVSEDVQLSVEAVNQQFAEGLINEDEQLAKVCTIYADALIAAGIQPFAESE